MTLNRRRFLTRAALGAAGAAAALSSQGGAAETAGGPRPRNRLAVSTYSFWQFRGSPLEVGACIEQAAAMGFDGVEILHKQMREESNSYLQGLKRKAITLGIDLCGFSTHQGFVSPDKEVRQRNIDHTIHCIELAYKLGIPTMRINTGRWGTTKSFDRLME